MCQRLCQLEAPNGWRWFERVERLPNLDPSSEGHSLLRWDAHRSDGQLRLGRCWRSVHAEAERSSRTALPGLVSLERSVLAVHKAQRALA